MEESLGEGEVTHLVSSWDIECLLHSDWNLQHHHSWLQTFGHGLEPHHWLPWAISLDMAGYGSAYPPSSPKTNFAINLSPHNVYLLLILFSWRTLTQHILHFLRQLL